MNDKSKPLARAASRQWITYGAGTVLILIGMGLAYRQLTGNTIALQKQAAKRDKEALELANKPPASAEGFSGRLDARRKEIEDRLSRERAAAQAIAPIKVLILPLTWPALSTSAGRPIRTPKATSTS